MLSVSSAATGYLNVVPVPAIDGQPTVLAEGGQKRDDAVSAGKRGGQESPPRRAPDHDSASDERRARRRVEQWRTREREMKREHARAGERARRQDEDDSKEAERFGTFAETYDDEDDARGDTRYYRGAALSKVCTRRSAVQARFAPPAPLTRDTAIICVLSHGTGGGSLTVSTRTSCDGPNWTPNAKRKSRRGGKLITSLGAHLIQARGLLLHRYRQPTRLLAFCRARPGHRRTWRPGGSVGLG